MAENQSSTPLCLFVFALPRHLKHLESKFLHNPCMSNSSNDRSGSANPSFFRSFWCGPVFTWALAVLACCIVSTVRWNFQNTIMNSSLMEGHGLLIIMAVMLQLFAMMLSFIGCTSPGRGISAALLFFIPPIYAFGRLLFNASL